MTELRAAKVAKIADDIPPLEVDDETGDAELLVLGWGSTYGAIKGGRPTGAAAVARRWPTPTSRHLNPFPANLGTCSAGIGRSWSPR